MTGKRFVLGYNKIKDKEDNIVYGLTSIDNQDFGLHKFIEKANALHEENIKLKWILTNYKPQDLHIPSKEEMKEFIEMLYEGDLK